MDIRCPTCGEPWDSYHMQSDEPGEWGMSKADTELFVKNGVRFSGPDDPALMAAQIASWRFAGQSVLSFTRCPSCAKRAPLHDAIKRRALVAAMTDALGDDEDGLACELDDMAAYMDRNDD